MTFHAAANLVNGTSGDRGNRSESLHTPVPRGKARARVGKRESPCKTPAKSGAVDDETGKPARKRRISLFLLFFREARGFSRE